MANKAPTRTLRRIKNGKIKNEKQKQISAEEIIKKRQKMGSNYIK